MTMGGRRGLVIGIDGGRNRGGGGGRNNMLRGAVYEDGGEEKSEMRGRIPGSEAARRR